MRNFPSAGARSFRWRMYCLSGTSAVIRTPCTAETMTAGRGARRGSPRPRLRRLASRSRGIDRVHSSCNDGFKKRAVRDCMSYGGETGQMDTRAARRRGSRRRATSREKLRMRATTTVVNDAMESYTISKTNTWNDPAFGSTRPRRTRSGDADVDARPRMLKNDRLRVKQRASRVDARKYGGSAVSHVSDERKPETRGV